MDQKIPNLRPVNDAAYADLIEGVRERFIDSRMRGSKFTEEKAVRLIDKELAGILPNSKETLGHFFFEIFDGNTDTKIGIAWLFIQYDTNSSFLFDIYLEQSARGKGLGRSTLTVIESFVKLEGASTLSLNVFAENNIARSLYQSSGFQEVNIDMIKEL